MASPHVGISFQVSAGRSDEDLSLMVTLGVDLAAQPKKTATSLICWDSIPARVELLSTGMQDSDLHKLFKQACKIGIDAPFGWPRPFVRAIQRYSTATEWPAAEVRQLRYRRTDEVVIERVGIFPLVSCHT